MPYELYSTLFIIPFPSLPHSTLMCRIISSLRSVPNAQNKQLFSVSFLFSHSLHIQRNNLRNKTASVAVYMFLTFHTVSLGCISTVNHRLMIIRLLLLFHIKWNYNVEYVSDARCLVEYMIVTSYSFAN